MVRTKLKKILFSGTLCLLGISVFSYLYNFNYIESVNAYSFQEKQTSGSEPVIKAYDFPPGAEVSYQIISSDRMPVSGQVIVNEYGQALLPAFDLSNSALAYNVVIEKDGHSEPLNIMMRMNKETGRIFVSGSGLSEFSEIRFEKDTGAYDTKADWAGLFHERDAIRIEDLSQSQSFKVAFQNYNLASDIIPARSPFVQIQFSGTNTTLSTEDSGAWQRLIEDIRKNYIRALMLMTEQLSAVMYQQVLAIGTFLDAKHQLESQRILQVLQAEAHKDYHPSDQMCRFGSFVKSVAHTESKAALDKQAINKVLMNRYMDTKDSSSAEGLEMDIRARLQQFREVYCDPNDNNAGLGIMCKGSVNPPPELDLVKRERYNKDIDYARTLDNPLTLDIDFRNEKGKDPNDPKDSELADEQDIVALAKNLYWPRTLEPPPENEVPKNYQSYLQARRLIATQNVAHDSFVNIVGMKSKAPDVLDSSGNVINKEGGWAFMKAMMREFKIPAEEIHEVLGDNPSYYAQMEVLSKKIYQHPNFYTNLYDKPVNVDRIGTSMKAINLMHDRDHYESLLRREILISLLVEQELLKKAENINNEIFGGLAKPQRK